MPHTDQKKPLSRPSVVGWLGTVIGPQSPGQRAGGRRRSPATQVDPTGAGLISDLYQPAPHFSSDALPRTRSVPVSVIVPVKNEAENLRR
jgi:hypothetical protein